MTRLPDFPITLRVRDLSRSIIVDGLLTLLRARLSATIQ